MKPITVAFALFCACITSRCVAQSYGMPTIETPRPAPIPTYGNYGTVPLNGQIQLGATADDIKRQTNRNNPYYGTPHSDIQKANERWIYEQMANDPAYNPALRNGVNAPYKLTKQEEISKLLQEAFQSEHPATNIKNLTSNYYKSADFQKITQPYNQALKMLEEMLSGKRPLSVAQAYFITENAYGNTYLNEAEYRAVIKKSADFIRQWAKQQGMNRSNKEDMHMAIQKFMGEQLSIFKPQVIGDGKTQVGSVSHAPFFYDYTDYTGEKDFKNYFLTKALATGGGQCSSLPAVYLVLAEALGLKAYMTTAPNHAFIKYPDNKGNLVNYEPTANWKLSDNWYRDNMFITAQAKKNHLYLDTLNSRQVVADCILSLALGYVNKHGIADAKFVSQCVAVADKEFNHENLQIRLVHSMMLSRMLLATMYHTGINDFSQLDNAPQAKKLYMELSENEQLLSQLGYTPQPPAMYEALLKQHEFKGNIQDSFKIDGKKKRNLFSEIK